MKILVTMGSKFTPEAKASLAKLGSVDCKNLTQEEFEHIIPEYDVLLVGLGLNITKEAIDKATHLKMIGTATTGLDHIDIEHAESKNIKIVSLRGETDFLNTITGTAELAFGLMIDLMRKTHASMNSVKNYEWDREKFRGHNLRGRTLGIVGLGRLGTIMARYGNAAYMNVVAHDPYVENAKFGEWNTVKVSFEELLERSDVVSIHVHLNDDTEEMFSQDTFKRMKDSVYLINTSRGKIVNEADVLKALENNIIGGYATDVLADELEFADNFSNHPLVEYQKRNDNLLIVPHIGGMTHESRVATDVFIVEKMKRIL